MFSEDETHRFQSFRSDGIEQRLEPAEREDMGITSDDPLDSEDNTALHRTLMSYYAQEIYVQEASRRAQMEDEEFYDGDQWAARDAAMLKERGQVPLVYNVIAPAVNWLLGTQRRSRTQFKVLPRRKDGARAAERKTQLLKYVQDSSKDQHNISRAFADAVKVGVGWLEEGFRGHDDDGEPVYARYESWRNMLWDTRATDDDLTDARYVFRAKWADLDTASKLFPSRAHVLHASSSANLDLGGMYLDNQADEPMDQQELPHQYAAMVGADGFGNIRRRVRLIEAWYKKPVEDTYLAGGDFSGEPYDPDAPAHRAAVADGTSSPVKRVKMRVHVAILTSGGILWSGPSPYRHNRYPFTPIWGNRKGADGTPYGLIRNLKDIQQDTNKRASKALHILSSSKVIMDEGAVEDLDELAEEVARPDAVISKKKGYDLRIDQDRQLAAPHMDLMSRNIEMIQQNSGITDEAMGRTTNAKSGKAIIARQNQGSVAIAHYLDNLRYAMQQHGEKLLSLVEQYYTDQKEFRITNSRGTADYATVNDGLPENDIIRTKADFIISEDDWSASIRQAQVDEFLEFLQMIGPSSPQVVLAILDLVVEAMDLPSKDEIVNRVRQITGMEDPDADPNAADPEAQARQAEKMAKAQMEARAAMAELRGMEATAAEKEAKAAKTMAETEKTVQSFTMDQLQQVEKALQTALVTVQGRQLVPVADALLAEARMAAQPQPQPQPPALV